MRRLGDILVRQASFPEILQVRWNILRAGMPVESAHFPGDDAPETIHVGAFVETTGINVGCASFMRADWQGQPAWQLRGMAVIDALQGQGIGALLLAEAEELARVGPVRQLWCNAREGAVRFYLKLGWELASERFEVPTAGPHFKMTRVMTEPPVPADRSRGGTPSPTTRS